tara:strand:+ start:364 stop:594 length:231 start_codon:yes stop_codon:yes gene_type:complete
MKNFKVFTRNWWKVNKEKNENGDLLWSKGLEPDGNGRKYTIAWTETEEEARKICKEKNEGFEKNKLGKMAEYMKIK